jgi:hypothetical protein
VKKISTKKASFLLKKLNIMETTDWSGEIHLKLFKKFTYYTSGHHANSVKVTDDYVLVGGGAQTFYAGGSPGSFITESRPNTALNTWYGRSKDHINAGKHTLMVYAIGMKIDGVSAAYLRSKMRVFSKESGVANHPSTHVSIPSNYQLIGGGARVKYNGNGNLLVHSYPDADTYGNVYSWHAKSKDHQVADRATIVAYAIGIENISFPNIGHIQTQIRGGNSPVSGGSGGSQEAFMLPISGWALTCPGAKSTFNGEGRMITSIYPDRFIGIKAFSRDHIQGSNGHLSAHLLMVRKRK